MMQPVSKFVGAVTLIALLAPSITFAQTGTAVPTTRQGGAVNFCSRIGELETKFNTGAMEREEKLGFKREERDLKLSQNRTERTAKLTQARTEHDANRSAHYAKLMEKADSETKKAAVTVFQTAVESAVTARKATVDAAIATFKTGVDKAIADRRAAVEVPVNALKNSINAAIAIAKTDCAAGKDAKTVREAFQASVKVAREKFQADRKAIEKIDAQVETLKTARKTTVDKAIADFKTALEKAKTDLKSAWGTPAPKTP